MKTKLISGLILFISFNSFCQIQITQSDGGSVITKLSYGIKVNDGSTLNRFWFTLNDNSCPLQLKDIGIMVSYATSYSFDAVGNVIPKEPIVAYEIHHVLYDMFGEHIKTLSNTEVKDISTPIAFDKYSSWYASENQVKEYLTCVSYVAYVRTKNGVIWRYDYKSIQSELMKIKLKYDEGFLPPNIKDKEK